MDLFELILTLPFGWKITTILLIIIGNVLFLFRKSLLSQLYKVTKKKTINLKDHKLFAEKTFLNYKINRINVGAEKKTYVFQKLLLIKYSSILKFCEELINKKELVNVSNSQFYAVIIKTMTLIVDDYNEKFEFEFGNDIYKLIMLHEEKGFNTIHENTVEFIKSNIEESLRTDHVVFKTLEDKLDFLFDMYYISMKIAMSDVDKIYKNFNGDLDKLIAKCKKCK